MQLRYTLLILFVLTSCSLFKLRQSDPILMEYVRHFEEQFQMTLHGVSINFDNLTSYDGNDNLNTIGICTPTGNMYIDKKFFENASERERLSVIYHEIGHCIFYWEHDDRMMNDYCPASIMTPVIPINYCLDFHWENYIEEYRDKIN